MKNTNNDIVSAVYDEKSGLLQRTLKNDVTVSVLFGGIGTPRMGKKGLYLDLPRPTSLIGAVLPFTVYDGGDVVSGTIEINDFCANDEQLEEAKNVGMKYVVGSYNVTLKVGRAMIRKNLKHHDLATLWCLATDCYDLARRELSLCYMADSARNRTA